MDKRPGLMIAHGDPLVLAALSKEFEKDPRFSLFATSGTAEGLLTMTLRLSIQLALVDWTIPNIGGQKLLEIFREQANSPKVIIYGDEDAGVPRLAMSAGAAAFINRKQPVRTLLDTCQKVAEGAMVFPFLDVRDLQSDPLGQLSKKETLILAALAEGQSNKEIARNLEISANTVKFHLTNVYGKLDVKNRTQAVSYYFSHRAG